MIINPSWLLPFAVYTNNTCDVANEFMCQNRECIPKHFVCDHDIDCSDGSDESPECGEWMCCLQEKWRKNEEIAVLRVEHKIEN